MTVHLDESWQLFAENGEPLPGSATREMIARDSSLLFGAAHVWVWRKSEDAEVQILLQKRAESKRTWPGHYDISAAGHINADEIPLQAAVREADEEIGLKVHTERLKYLFSLRTPLDIQEIDHVYLYEASLEFSPTYTDGEVSECKWIRLDEFIEMTRSPESYSLVDQGVSYFSLLQDNLELLL